ncbi:hypothetical protein [Brevundimonas diminuta]|uniref:hypothetical protein n=1 Tax=Brevundimonas diminuta TaxID=293 RepID=UPI003D0488A9
MILFTGLPGFFFAAFQSLPWSLVAIAFWSVLAWQGLKRTRLGPLTEGELVIRGIGAGLLLITGLTLPFLTRSWPDAASTFLWFAPPTLLIGLAVTAAKDHTQHGRRLIAWLIPIALLQLQLMLLSLLMYIGDVFTGGSPI